MRSDAAPDLSHLARLAQHPGEELRPLLLRVQTMIFVSAPSRDGDAAASFETLALGLIPLVSDDVLAEMAAQLSAVPETPPGVQAALAARLRGRCETSGGDSEGSSDHAAPDMALARNMAVILDGQPLAALLRRASDDPALATALLERPDLGALDRAVLYRFADTETRHLVRQELEAALAVFPAPGPALRTGHDEAVAAAEGGDLPRLLDVLARGLGLGRRPDWDLDDEAGAELFLLALVALGLSPAGCVGVLLMLRAELSRSVPAVFRLAAIARDTPRPVAAHLVGSARAGRPRRGEDGRPSTPVVRGRLREDGRSDPVSPDRPGRAGSDRDGFDRAGRRSTATTGRDRT